MIPAVLPHNQRRNHEHPIAQGATGVFQDFNCLNLDLRLSRPQFVQQALGEQAARSDGRFVVDDLHGHCLLFGARPHFRSSQGSAEQCSNQTHIQQSGQQRHQADDR